MKLSPVLRSIDIMMVAILIAMVVWTFKVKHDSQEALDRVAVLEKQIEAEKNRVDLLKSDWSLLTSPKRLEKLVKHYGAQLALRPIEPAQLADDNSLPALKKQDILQINEKVDGFAGVDQSTYTGSVAIPSQREGQ